MCKCNDASRQETADAIYESFKARDPAYATPRVRAWIEQSIESATCIASVQLLMGILAAPRYRKKVFQRAPDREALFDLLDKYLALAASDGWADGSSVPRTIELTRQMRALLETWEFSLDVPEPIVSVARAWLAAYETPEPPEGWDQWPGLDVVPPQFAIPEQPSRGGP
ncbi:hypothetical protein WME73_04955 [Sorangium sp. So ce302]|uniref:hypothetical protein n=1 Tax=Sorangium sp. So ce302 TaxID=3133297 RepID=UPI003F62F710